MCLVGLQLSRGTIGGRRQAWNAAAVCWPSGADTIRQPPPTHHLSGGKPKSLNCVSCPPPSPKPQSPACATNKIWLPSDNCWKCRSGWRNHSPPPTRCHHHLCWNCHVRVVCAPRLLERPTDIVQQIKTCLQYQISSPSWKWLLDEVCHRPDCLCVCECVCVSRLRLPFSSMQESNYDRSSSRR